MESGDLPDFDAPAAEFVTYFEQEEASLFLGGYLFMLGTLLFLWFLSFLRDRLIRSEGGSGSFSTLAFATGILGGVALMATHSSRFGASFATTEDAQLEPGAAQAAFFVGDGFFVIALLLLATFLITTGLLALRGLFLPKWLAWITIALGVLMLIPWVGWIGMIFVFPLWTIVSSFFVRNEPPAIAQPTV